MTDQNFSRVDETNTVFVLENGSERQVGQFLGVSKEEALAFFIRKFDDLEAQVRILEQRVVAGSSNPKALISSYKKLVLELVEPQAVGDLVTLRTRLAKLDERIHGLSEKASEEQSQAIESALNAKAAIAAKAEDITGRIPNLNWKKSGEEMAALFLEWQTLQKSGSRVPKGKADPIWKRFSQARAKFETARRAYFATLDGKAKEAKGMKLALTEQAEALAAKGGDGSNEYRKLLDSWKASPRSGKADEALWSRFKKAGDAIYAIKKAKDNEQNTEEQANLGLKLELLRLAESVDVANLDDAKVQISSVRAKWVAIGHVPRADVKTLEERLRKVENKLRDAEQERWRRSDPSAKDRSNSLVTQLEAVIVALEGELSEAAAAKKKDIQLQIDSRKALLAAALAAVD